MEKFIVFLPLLGAIISGVFSRRIPDAVAQRITSLFLVISAVLASIVFYKVIFKDYSTIVEVLPFINLDNFKVSWSLKVDSLTAVMLVVVTYVSAAVHIYSIGYMSHDPHKPRFMSYLSLFTFFMLMLITSDNLIQLFLGWEGVGLCSYLLIGFWYEKPEANKAAIKAFLVNRVGDFGFALGIFATYMIFGSVNFSDIFGSVSSHATDTISFLDYQFNAITVICILLFIGAMGKSAQLGLHTWLPDAMEGPTPVSALIHAATMVTAGVFLVARCSPLFEYSDVARQVVTYVGGATAIFAATVAITQNDIKRVIAYSTCSQLGYMFFACGVSAYSAAIFHLMTHAFFKALLFLGSGSVIHALDGEQDMRKMGGIWKHIPVTYGLMWIGSLALAGVYPFAGYFSKDLILESAYVSGGAGTIVYWVGISAAFLTAFYSWRLIIMTFHGKAKASEEVMSHIHESPSVMLMPLYILALGAILSGAVGYSIFNMVDYHSSFWGSAIFVMDKHNPLESVHHIEGLIKYLPSIVGALGIALAYLLYLLWPSVPEVVAKIFSPIYKFLLNKWYFDELYDYLFVRPSMALGKLLWKVGDVRIIDGFGPNGVAWASDHMGARICKVQDGYIFTYASIMIVGLLVVVSWYLYNFVVGM